ncbi:alpha/beta fold hydrolase [uncultured Shimia sp.]|uniref:alpha/beta fold hydrolase n=1 Tax=uncultured Shimia sp. TaxID=573152 RepID=UPI00261AC244|nr:alpha/beta fold hydrolase [uncultured Shimia sp.]
MIRTLVTAAIVAVTATLALAEGRWTSIPQPAAMPETSNSGTAAVNGIEMYYAVYGEAEGTPILMIHGGLAHADIWSAQVADLMADYKVIVADTRGHGRSTNDGSDYSYGLLASDYLALMDHLGVEKVHLVGWSDGANIGYSISQTNPERLATHFAHAGNVTLDGIDPSVETNETFGAYVGAMAADYAKLSPTPEGFEDFLGGVAAMWGTEKPGGVDALGSVPVKTVVVQSQYDEAILMAHAEMIASTIPGATLVLQENVSHFSMFQAPDEYTADIRAFLGN